MKRLLCFVLYFLLVSNSFGQSAETPLTKEQTIDEIQDWIKVNVSKDETLVIKDCKLINTRLEASLHGAFEEESIIRIKDIGEITFTVKLMKLIIDCKSKTGCIDEKVDGSEEGKSSSLYLDMTAACNEAAAQRFRYLIAHLATFCQ